MGITKESERITKESERIPKESERIQGNLKDSNRIQKT